MPKCDGCKVHDDIESHPKGTFRYEDLPCATCTLEITPSNHGRVHVSVMDMPDFEVLNIIHETPDYVAQEMEHAQGVYGGLDDEQKTAIMVLFQHLLSTLVRMDSTTRDILCLRMLGYGYSDIAQNVHLGVSTVANRHKKALLEYPILLKAFPAKRMED